MHLGDGIDDMYEFDLEKDNITLYKVLGNNDYDLNFPLTKEVEFENTLLLLEHIPSLKN